MRSHDSKLQAGYIQVLPGFTGNLYQFCEKVCWSAAGLKHYMKVYRVNVSTKDRSFACHMCVRGYNRKAIMHAHMLSLWD